MTADDAKAKVKAQYGAVGDAYVKSAGHATGNDLERMVALANPVGTERVLDNATGGGHVARAFAPHVASVVASDLTPEILAHAGQAFSDWGLTNVTTAEADAENLPFADASFEIVTCRIAPHHFPNPAAFVREVARVLVSGGQFLLVDSTVPAGEIGEWFNEFETIRDRSHVRSLTIEEWTHLIEESGMWLSYSESYRKTHDFADWVARSRTPDEDIAALERMVREASTDVLTAFEFQMEDGQLRSFTDTKSLFHATRE